MDSTGPGLSGINPGKIDAKSWNFKVVNAGQSGDTSAGGLNRLDWLLKNRVDILILELGANDGLRGLPAETTRNNLQAIIERTKGKYPEVKVIVAGMKVPSNMGGDYGRKFEARSSSIWQKEQSRAIPFVLEGVGGSRELNLPDGIHPTAKGHEIVAANVWKVLEPILRSLAGKENEQPDRRKLRSEWDTVGAGLKPYQTFDYVCAYRSTGYTA